MARRSHKHPRLFRKRARPVSTPRPSKPLSTVAFWCLVVFCWWIMQMPLVGKPFSLLGTWAHEMGHGMGAVLSGGEFKRMFITPLFGGQATTITTSTFGRVMVIVFGLLGPSLAGAIILLLARGSRQSGFALFLLCAALFVSAWIWADDVFTKITLFTLAAAIFGISALGGRFIKSIFAQIIAIELCLNAVMGFDYFFSGVASVAGDTSMSDTASLAQILGGTHTLWGLLLSVMSILILWTAFKLSGALNVGISARRIG